MIPLSPILLMSSCDMEPENRLIEQITESVLEKLKELVREEYE